MMSRNEELLRKIYGKDYPTLAYVLNIRDIHEEKERLQNKKNYIKLFEEIMLFHNTEEETFKNIKRIKAKKINSEIIYNGEDGKCIKKVV